MTKERRLIDQFMRERGFFLIRESGRHAIYRNIVTGKQIPVSVNHTGREMGRKHFKNLKKEINGL
jgi:predicted RNA binding protein YcfA (HicA-like mRNA interferase family)